MSFMKTMSEKSRNPQSSHYGERSHWAFVYHEDRHIVERIRRSQDKIDDRNIQHQQEQNGTVIVQLKDSHRKLSHKQQKFIYHALVTEGSSEEAIREALPAVPPKKPENIKLRMFWALVRYIENRSNQPANAYERAYWTKLKHFDHDTISTIHKLIASRDRKPHHASRPDRRYLPRSLNGRNVYLLNSDSPPGDLGAETSRQSTSQQNQPYIELRGDGKLHYLPPGSSVVRELTVRQQRLVYTSRRYFGDSSEFTIRLLLEQCHGNRQDMPKDIEPNDIERIVQHMDTKADPAKVGMTSLWLHVTENHDKTIKEINDLKAQISATVDYPPPPASHGSVQPQPYRRGPASNFGQPQRQPQPDSQGPVSFFGQLQRQPQPDSQGPVSFFGQLQGRPQPERQGPISTFGKISRGAPRPLEQTYHLEQLPQQHTGYGPLQYAAGYAAAGYTSTTGQADYGPPSDFSQQVNYQQPPQHQAGYDAAGYMSTTGQAGYDTSSDSSRQLAYQRTNSPGVYSNSTQNHPTRDPRSLNNPGRRRSREQTSQGGFLEGQRRRRR